MNNKKTPCALLMNDIHVSKDNIPEFRKNWDEALAICQKRDISEIIIGGDLWQSRSAQSLSTLLAVRDAIEKAQAYGIQLTIAEGNHDLVDQEALEGYSHIFDGYEGVTVIGDWDVIGFDPNLDLYIMSYFPENGSFMDRLQTVLTAVKSNSVDCIKVLYIHEGIRGGLAQPSDDELPAEIFQDFDSVLVGHYHDRKLIPGTKIQYIGASRQTNFGEDEEKGYTILYSDGSNEFIKNEVNTRYVTVNVDYAELNSPEFTDKMNGVTEDERYKAKVRVTCQSSEAETVDKDALLNAGASKIEVVTEQTEIKQVEAHALDQKFDKAGIKDEYKNFCAAKNIQADMGLTYLDKIN